LVPPGEISFCSRLARRSKKCRDGKDGSETLTKMSALPPKPNMCGATRDVRFGPIADINGSIRTTLLRVLSVGGTAIPAVSTPAFTPINRSKFKLSVSPEECQ